MAICLAAEFAVVPVSGALQPGLSERVWVGVFEQGRPTSSPPVVTAVGGRVRFGDTPSAPGIWPLVVTPDADVDAVRLTVSAGASIHEAELAVRWPDRAPLTAPARIDVVASEPEVSFLVTGDDLPDADDLDVTLGEGAVTRLVRTDDGLRVDVRLSDSPLARVVPIGLRDLRSDTRPSWTAIRVRARPRIPLEAQPGGRIDLEVGGRTYGPFTVGPDGRLDARVDQYPGEAAVTVRLSDDIGNQSVSTLPLATSDLPLLHLVPGSRPVPQRGPRRVWIRALQPAGAAWRGAAPTCRTPGVGAIPVDLVSTGLFAATLSERNAAPTGETRLECRIGESLASTRVGPIPDVPSTVLLQVWPTELSTDLPVAEVRVAVEDALGRRLPVENVQLRAERGVISSRSSTADRAEAEYDGQNAVEAGEDIVFATYRQPVVVAPVAALRLSWQRVVSGRIRAEATAFDRRGQRVSGAEISLSAGDTPTAGFTGEEGTVRLDVGYSAGSGPLVLLARSGATELRALASRVDDGSYTVDTRGTPPELQATRRMVLAPGRVSGISVGFEPPILRTGRSSVAYVTVALEDRSGQAVLDSDVRLEVSEGTVGPLVPRPDGSLVAEYRPGSGERARDVTVVASTESLRSSARLELEPRLGIVSVGPTVGLLSNLGSLNAPFAGVDLDLRTGLLGGTVLVRAGVAGYGFAATAATGIGPDVSLRGTVVPGTVALLLRQDRGGVGFWGGAGGVAALHGVTARFDDTEVSGVRVVTGATLLGGIGYRVALGDLVAEARWTLLPGPGGEVGFTGNLGGVALAVGYRFVY